MPSAFRDPGVDVFVERDIPFLKQYDTKIIVNVCGKTKEDYLDVVERLGDEPMWTCWRSTSPVPM